MKLDRKFPEYPLSFNMTPIIDIVFLLMIFFLVVYKFIEAENFQVHVPQGCEFAAEDDDPARQVTTLSVFRTGEKTVFAVGAEKITASAYPDMVHKMAAALDARLGPLTPEQRIVTLRIDKDICFDEAQYALAAVAESIAADIKIAAIQDSPAKLP